MFISFDDIEESIKKLNDDSIKSLSLEECVKIVNSHETTEEFENNNVKVKTKKLTK